MLLAIACNEGEQISRVQLAEQADCCFQTAKRSVQRLVAMRYVSVTHFFDGEVGAQLANVYHLTDKARKALGLDGVDGIRARRSHRGASPG